MKKPPRVLRRTSLSRQCLEYSPVCTDLSSCERAWAYSKPKLHSCIMKNLTSSLNVKQISSNGIEKPNSVERLVPSGAWKWNEAWEILGNRLKPFGDAFASILSFSPCGACKTRWLRHSQILGSAIVEHGNTFRHKQSQLLVTYSKSSASS